MDVLITISELEYLLDLLSHDRKRNEVCGKNLLWFSNKTYNKLRTAYQEEIDIRLRILSLDLPEHED
jgi:hypothetical protein